MSRCPVAQAADVATVKSLSQPNNFLSINLEARVSHFSDINKPESETFKKGNLLEGGSPSIQPLLSKSLHRSAAFVC